MATLFASLLQYETLLRSYSLNIEELMDDKGSGKKAEHALYLVKEHIQ